MSRLPRVLVAACLLSLSAASGACAPLPPPPSSVPMCRTATTGPARPRISNPELLDPFSESTAGPRRWSAPPVAVGMTEIR